MTAHRFRVAVADLAGNDAASFFGWLSQYDVNLTPWQWEDETVPENSVPDPQSEEPTPLPEGPAIYQTELALKRDCPSRSSLESALKGGKL
jgi:hypothetical protein